MKDNLASASASRHWPCGRVFYPANERDRLTTFERGKLRSRPGEIGGGEASALVDSAAVDYSSAVSTLSEIEAAADALTPEQKQELLLFLAARLRGQGAKLPEPRKFSREQVSSWMAQDEADMQRFRESK
jgi:hypothetical protein